MNLRPYQLAAADAASAILNTDRRACLVSMPCGTGKTRVLSEIAARFPKPVLAIAHRRELLDQMSETLELRFGVRPGRGYKGSDKVQVASVQQLCAGMARGQFGILPKIGTLLIDECHRSAATSYKWIMEHCPQAKVVGLTATPFRSDTQPLEPVIGPVCFEYSLRQAQCDGWLLKLREQEVEATGPVEQAEAIRRQVRKSGRIIVFVRDQVIGRRIVYALGNLGLSAKLLRAGLPKEKRRAITGEFRAGKLDCLINVSVCTEGFDVPELGAVAVCRSVASKVLWTQICGRSSRPLPGILDGWNTPEQRLNAIAASGKPFGLVLKIKEPDQRGIVERRHPADYQHWAQSSKRIEARIREKDPSVWLGDSFPDPMFPVELPALRRRPAPVDSRPIPAYFDIENAWEVLPELDGSELAADLSSENNARLAAIGRECRR